MLRESLFEEMASEQTGEEAALQVSEGRAF